MIRILKPGPGTTIQDMGRRGFEHLGVPPSGHFDLLAAMAANRCVGNDITAPSFEATLIGPQLEIPAGTTVAVVGDGLKGTVCGEELVSGRPVTTSTDGTLEVRSTGKCARFPIAFRGGLVAPTHLGSASQLARARLGAPPLSPEDHFELGAPPEAEPVTMQTPSLDRVVRVITRDPRWKGGTWIVAKDSDRRGVRFEIAEGAEPEGGERDPEPMPRGAVQVPPSGEPIVLGPDGPVTGGYRLLGAVARADMSVIAQSPPGTRLRVEPITLEAAVQTWQDAVRAWTQPST